MTIRDRAAEILFRHVNTAVLILLFGFAVLGGEWRFTYYVREKEYQRRLEHVDETLRQIEQKLKDADDQ